MGDWNKYQFTREQLAQYAAAFTGKDGISVLDGYGGSTHLPTLNVRIAVGAGNAQDLMAHEATHINETDDSAFGALSTNVERKILNLLEDARMERKSFHENPGLRVQYQVNIVDEIMPMVLEEAWMAQAVKSIYLLTTPYTFPRDEFRPKAKAFMRKYEASGIIADARFAKTTLDLLPLVPRVLALFDEQVAPSKPQDADDEGQPTASQNEGQPIGPEVRDRNGDIIPHRNGDDGECPACNAIDAAERAAVRGDTSYERGEASYNGDASYEDGSAGYDDDSGEEVESAARSPREYDVDKARHEAEAARKEGATAKSAKPTKVVGGRDRATGGPTVNRLVQQSKRLVRDLERLDNKARDRSLARARTERFDTPPRDQQADKGNDKIIAGDIPETAKPMADLDKFFAGRRSPRDRYVSLDLKSLFSPEASGALGYGGTAMRLVDSRECASSIVGDTAESVDAQLRAVVNFLSRQMTVFLQTESREGLRDYERTGRLDAPRAYQMGGARFDVYKNPPNPTNIRPVVVLTTDMSGSMGGYGSNTPSFHAMASTILLAQSLRRLGVPFETHGFSSADLFILKTFDQPVRKRTVRAFSNLMSQGGGGTPAAESLAFAWARARTRPEERRIVIQVTDGSVPDNAKRMVTAIQKDGGIVIGVGIGGVNIGDTFTHAIRVDQAHELPNRFARLLKKLVLSGEFSKKGK